MANWYKDKKGYPRFSDSGKLVHRWKAEKKLGRPLGDDEVVHHRDGNKSNYSDGNLGTMSRRHHGKVHARKKSGSWFW